MVVVLVVNREQAKILTGKFTSAACAHPWEKLQCPFPVGLLTPLLVTTHLRNSLPYFLAFFSIPCILHTGTPSGKPFPGPGPDIRRRRGSGTDYGPLTRPHARSDILFRPSAARLHRVFGPGGAVPGHWQGQQRTCLARPPSLCRAGQMLCHLQLLPTDSSLRDCRSYSPGDKSP
jgi:hypothetical protein